MGKFNRGFGYRLAVRYLLSEGVEVAGERDERWLSDWGEGVGQDDVGNL